MFYPNKSIFVNKVYNVTALSMIDVGLNKIKINVGLLRGAGSGGKGGKDSENTGAQGADCVF